MPQPESNLITEKIPQARDVLLHRSSDGDGSDQSFTMSSFLGLFGRAALAAAAGCGLAAATALCVDAVRPDNPNQSRIDGERRPQSTSQIDFDITFADITKTTFTAELVNHVSSRGID